MVTLGLVVAQFNAPITEKMKATARDRADELGADVVDAVSVPGAYDAPLAADRLARRSDVDAVVALGAIVTGDTDHDQIIADAAAQGLTRVSIERDTPVALGITGPGMSAEEAYDRIDRAGEAVEGALDMVEAL
jgi:6,7-dimethyl-8-ribityllumazine synthase